MKSDLAKQHFSKADTAFAHANEYFERDKKELACNEDCFCGHGTLERHRVTVDLHRDDRLIMIKNVPALVCDACGERQYPLEISREIDRILEEFERTGQAKEEMKVPVASME